MRRKRRSTSVDRTRADAGVVGDPGRGRRFSGDPNAGAADGSYLLNLERGLASGNELDSIKRVVGSRQRAVGRNQQRGISHDVDRVTARERRNERRELPRNHAVLW